MARRTLIDFFADLSAIAVSSSSSTTGIAAGPTRTREIAAAARAFGGRLRDGADRQRPDGGHLGGEPRRVDRRALGLHPRGRRAGPDRLPRVGRFPARGSSRSSTRAPSWSATRPRSRRFRRTAGVEAVGLRGLRRSALGAGGLGTRGSGSRAIAERRTAGAESSAERPAPTADSTAEIIFTSGATAEPKGVVITHRNILANIVPVEREMLKYRQVRAAVLSDPLPEPAAAQPHVRPGDGDLHPADAAAASSSSCAATTRRTSSGRSRTRRISVLVSVPKILDVLREHVAARRAGGGERRRPKHALGPALVALPAASTGCSA